MSDTNTAPFVKWAGGKRQLLEHLSVRMPKEYTDYYEPFVGGGALLFHQKPSWAFINDINRELIHTYTEIRDHVGPLSVLLSSMDQVTCTKEFYYEMRGRYNDKLKTKDYDTEMAALFIYLNKHCFNGLYRVNQKGQFNVPWNQKEQVRSVDVENIKNISYYLKSVTITCQDFEVSLETAKKGDFIYFDSPYAPLNPTSFDSYTKEGFTEEEHRRLAKVFRELSERGCYCMLTNHNTELIQELYQDYLQEEVDVRRAINSDPKKRVGKEVIIRNYGEIISGEE
ncbi:MAG: DNA adenine methylase [Lachnospiraceae bacterium]|nr:DNA adenine methylase [Lachnospiraceae bacterium]MCI9622928.1 DNA adenine methylase [Lachnospiraceae bacterium]